MIGLTEISQKSDIFRKNMCQVSDINFTVIYQKLGQNVRKKCQKKNISEIYQWLYGHGTRVLCRPTRHRERGVFGDSDNDGRRAGG